MAQIYVFTILGLVLMGLAYGFYLRDKFQKAVIGHVWATFITKTNSRIDSLCKVSGNIVTPPPKLFSDNPASTTYVIRGDKTANFNYPPLFPKFLQATVPSVVYGEGNAEPFDPHNRPSVLSDQLIYNLTNEQATGLTMKGLGEALRADEMIKALETASGGNKTLLYICLGLLAGLGLLGFLLFQMSGKVGELLALHGL